MTLQSTEYTMPSFFGVDFKAFSVDFVIILKVGSYIMSSNDLPCVPKKYKRLNSSCEGTLVSKKIVFSF